MVFYLSCPIYKEGFGKWREHIGSGVVLLGEKNADYYLVSLRSLVSSRPHIKDGGKTPTTTLTVCCSSHIKATCTLFILLVI